MSSDKTMEKQRVCGICKCEYYTTKDNKKIAVLEKPVKRLGITKLIERSKQVDDNKWEEWESETSLYVHDSCRRGYGNRRSVSIARESSSSAADPTVSTDINDSFDFQTDCFLCGKTWNIQTGQIVNRIFMEDRLLSSIQELDDNTTLKKRIRNQHSLIELGARFHDMCYERFWSNCNDDQGGTSGLDKQMKATMNKICQYIEEKRPDPVFLSELKKIMGSNFIETQKLIRRLKKKYGDIISIDQHRGRDTKIYFKSFTLSGLYSDWIADESSLKEKERDFIVKFAAEILYKDIKTQTYNLSHYNTPGKFFSTVENDIPDLLLFFLKSLSENHNRNIVDSIRLQNLAHIILSLLRPNSFCSHLHLALGIYIHRKTGSKLIIDILSALGVCCSYSALRLFEASVILDPPKTTIDECFVQFVFDNTDHNVATLDGHRTFHSLGGICIYTPEHGMSMEGSSKKLVKMPAASEIPSVNRIEDAILPSDYKSGWNKIEYVDPNKLSLIDSVQLAPYYGAYLWAKHFKIKKIPTWKGFMEVISGDKIINDVSRIECLPFVNHKASDVSTIYTSLMRALQETRKINQKTCIVTFDQPLYKKGLEIVHGLDLNIHLRLGGLHTIMAFLGASAHIMQGSGLAELWGVVYAPNSIKHMMSGHATARAIRAHTLTYTALGSIICGSIDQDLEDRYKQRISILCEKFSENELDMGSCSVDASVIDMSNALIRQLNVLKKNGPTAELWIQYFESITILLQFIEAERLGNWKLHLQSVRKMLPLFHATGNHQYAQCAHIYLQEMVNLELTMDEDEFRKFTENGYWTIRRTDKAFSGIPTDMTIKQTSNRFSGTDLVHARGVSESIVARYLGAMPSCSMIMEGLEEFCGIYAHNSDQQVDLQNSSMKLDDEHLTKFVNWLRDHQPFAPRSSIVSLSTGTIGGKEVNCHKAFEKGKEAMDLMIGKKVSQVKMSRFNVVKNLESAKDQLHLFVKNDGVNATLLFESISSLLTNETITREALNYELSPYPLSLFTTKGFMRQPDESFYPFIKRTDNNMNAIINDLTLVIDGNYLVLNAISSWPHGKTYQDICESYLAHLRQRYSHQFNARKLYVVFEHYNDEVCGVKSYAQYCQNRTNTAADFHLESKAFVNLTKKEFLSNICNKIKFVQLMSNFLKDHVTVIMSLDDCTTEAVKTAIRLKTLHRGPVGIVSDDIDIMILLITLTPEYERDVFFCKDIPAECRLEFCPTSEYADIRSFLLLVHTFCGCDSTSAIFNKGKSSLLKLIGNDVNLQNIVKDFYKPGCSEAEICIATEKLMLYMYNTATTHTQSLDEIRYQRFVASSSSSSSGGTEKRLAMLPPTLSAAHEHGKRVYYQMQKWTGNLSLRPDEWGWKRLQTILIPVMTTNQPAPAKLCDTIFCGCARTKCQTNPCKCRKVGIKCKAKCKNCKGLSCMNPYSNTDEPKEDSSDGGETSDSPEDEEGAEIRMSHDNRHRSPGYLSETQWASGFDFDDFNIISYDSF